MIASFVLVTSQNHGIDPQKGLYMNQDLKCAPVHIKKGAWIGEKVVILPGVIIGEGSVIGAGSVITKSIPDYSIAVGNPAHVIKKFDFLEKKWTEIV